MSDRISRDINKNSSCLSAFPISRFWGLCLCAQIKWEQQRESFVSELLFRKVCLITLLQTSETLMLVTFARVHVANCSSISMKVTGTLIHSYIKDIVIQNDRMTLCFNSAQKPI
jgi:hypothetical protein